MSAVRKSRCVTTCQARERSVVAVGGRVPVDTTCLVHVFLARVYRFNVHYRGTKERKHEYSRVHVWSNRKEPQGTPDGGKNVVYYNCINALRGVRRVMGYTSIEYARRPVGQRNTKCFPRLLAPLFSHEDTA